MKRASITIATNTAAICLEVTLFVVADVPTGLTVACMLFNFAFMLGALRVAWANMQFARGSYRAHRSLKASKNARLETERLADELRRRIAKAEAFVESVEAGGDFAEEERKQQLEELNQLMRRVKEAQAISHSKYARAQAAVDDLDRLLENVKATEDSKRNYSARLANGLVGLAVFLAGPSYAHLADTWRADIIGVPEENLVLSPQRRLVYARGLVYASLRIRAAALIGPLWRPVDWLLASNKRVDTVIAAIVGAMAIYLGRNLHDLLTDASGPCALTFALLKAGAARLRRMRGIELIGRAQAGENRSH
ncbi:hypothetical protein ACFW08_25520 [Streptomyces sp. NPDC058960]|uniref:hypothetical protein n=1 Tax=Streptomyces sp. NPDC058960 TaxID=3346679 RepID=UPI0036BE7DBB